MVTNILLMFTEIENNDLNDKTNVPIPEGDFSPLEKQVLLCDRFLRIFLFGLHAFSACCPFT